MKKTIAILFLFCIALSELIRNFATDYLQHEQRDITTTE
jgi:hypothetical protein